MYCKNCGKEINPGAEVCVSCGSKVGTGSNFCQHCGGGVDRNAEVCLKCGFSLKNKGSQEQGSKSKIAAGLLGILLGAFGIHNFYLGFTAKGVIQLVLTIAGVVTCGITSFAAGLWGLIEGIIILTGKNGVDANGQLLKD